MNKILLKILLGIFISNFHACNGQKNVQVRIIEQRIEPITILQSNWGSGSGEFGIVIEEDMPFGPPHIAVDRDGEIYVADEYNSRVQVFDRTGVLTWVISIEEKALLDRITIDNSGNMYLVNHRIPKIAVFDHNLKLLHVNVVSDIPPAGGGVGYGFTINADGEPVLIYNMHKDDSKQRTLIKSHKDGFVSKPLNALQIDDDLYGYPTIERKKGQTNIVEITIEPQGGISKSFQIEEHKKIWSRWEIGVDKKGQFYYSTETEDSLFVYIINFETNIIRKIPIITNLWHGAYRCPVLGLDGNIYYMGSSEEKFWIDKYPLHE